MKVINFTTNPSVAKNLAASVKGLSFSQRGELQALLTFDNLPSPADIEVRTVAVKSFLSNKGFAA